VIRLMTITYGTSMPRAGAVHLINCVESLLSAVGPLCLWQRASKA
jgi:hypothetical protein